MANLTYITSVVFVNLCCIVFARVISRESLPTDLRSFRDRFRGESFPRLPEPWQFTFKPPTRFTFIPPNFTFDPPVSQRSNLDLAFIMDSTGSMSPYINNVRQHIHDLVDEIVASSSTNLRLALIEYRDHGPQDIFVTRKHDFTHSVSTMKSWLNAARASGGGDKPEAVAQAMYEATFLSWRSDSAKISVLISDAPPHGLIEPDSYPEGNPDGRDPIKLARKLARKGITLYTVGCEPSINPYKDFFMALAYLTGGQYISLSSPRFLTDAIKGGAKEELSLQKFSSDVQKEIKKVQAAGRPVDEKQIAQTVFTKLKSEGAKATQLVQNNKPLEGASANAKAIAASTSMPEAKKIFTKGGSGGSSDETPSLIGAKVFDVMRRLPSRISSVSRVSSFDSAGGRPSKGMSGSSGSFATVDSAVSLDQISRLVRQESARLSV